jgi:hypothetical protein
MRLPAIPWPRIATDQIRDSRRTPPDGDLNVDGLAKDLAFIKTLGLVKSNVVVADIMAFAKAAAD